MKVLETTPTRLKLQHRPFSDWVGGSVLVVGSSIGLIYLVGFRPWIAHLSCDRPTPPQINCVLTQQAVLRPVQQLRLFTPYRASVITKQGSKGGPQYEVSLASLEGETTLLPSGTSGYAENTAIADRINQYLQTPQQRTLVLQYSEAGAVFWLGLFALISGATGIALTLTPSVTCLFYKRLDQVLIERRRWNGRNEIYEQRLCNVLTAELEEKQVKSRKVYRAVLVLASAERLLMNRDFTSEKNARQVVYWVQKFLATRS